MKKSIRQFKRNPTKMILIIDDFDLIAKTYAQVVKRLGASPLFATNGLEAIEVLAHHPVDGIILDVHMPRMNGPSFLNWLRQQPLPAGEIPVIVSSGGADALPGADAYMYKGVSGPTESMLLIKRVFGL